MVGSQELDVVKIVVKLKIGTTKISITCYFLTMLFISVHPNVTFTTTLEEKTKNLSIHTFTIKKTMALIY